MYVLLIRFGAVICMLLSGRYLAAQIQASGDSVTTVYLTFDDGPMKVGHYLDSVVFRHIPLTLFLVGQRVSGDDAMKDKLKQYRSKPTLDLCNHSYTHASGRYRSYYEEPGNVVADIMRNADSLQLCNNIVRLPGRNTWRVNGRQRTDLKDADTAADSLKKIGYTLIGWDLEWRYDTCEKRYFSAEEMTGQISYAVSHNRTFEKAHVIILCHDWALADEYFREQLFLFIDKTKAIPSVKFSRLSLYPGAEKQHDP